jgi:hypothetical protein
MWQDNRSWDEEVDLRKKEKKSEDLSKLMRMKSKGTSECLLQSKFFDFIVVWE